MNKKKQLYMIIVFTLAIVIGVGYALLNSTLNITGNTKIKENSWDVHFENFAPKSGSVTATSAGINTGGTAVNYTVTLTKPGDFYEFEVDVVNEGSIDAMINTISNTGLTNAQKRYMTYSVAYSDGTEIAEKQLLEAETGKETIKVKVEYKKDISAGDLPSTEQTISLTFSVNYVQADGSAVAVRDYICKRAKTLHTNETYPYGSLGTNGTLTPGDAFDCDVNGDGTYNAETERFYYVIDLDTNNDYAVLSYYSTVSGGVPDTDAKFAYDSTNRTSTDTSYYGPLTAKLQLPTTSQWSNVSLYSTTRNITDETGVVRVSNFSYAGYAARLLTSQEALASCGYDSISGWGYRGGPCNYLGEPSNSLFYWYENVYSQESKYAHYSLGTFGHVIVTNSYGVRPAIEVPKSKISY